MRLDKVIVNPSSFGKRRFKALPATLNLDPFPQRTIQSFDSVIRGVRLSDSRVFDVVYLPILRGRIRNGCTFKSSVQLDCSYAV